MLIKLNDDDGHPQPKTSSPSIYLFISGLHLLTGRLTKAVRYRPLKRKRTKKNSQTHI